MTAGGRARAGDAALRASDDRLPDEASVETLHRAGIPERRTAVRIADDHPAFAGHFPGAPVLPGVVLLDLALDAARAAGDIATGAIDIGVAKFFRPVLPGTDLVIVHRALGNGDVEFAIEADGERVAAGTFVAHEATP